MKIQQDKFTNLQLQLLKLYSYQVDEKDLMTIKFFLGNYFANKAIEEADKVWDRKGYNAYTIKQWLKEK
ncbi:MAG: hypothetical protein ABI723_04230 [Bacteroidia bacterium]